FTPGFAMSVILTARPGCRPPPAARRSARDRC
ncbi:hypothetical protein AZZ78_002435, partial [Klebsiella pneumoniae]